MGDSSLYDADILIWSEQQAAALRNLASHRDLPNELDLVQNILTHLVLLAADPDAPATHGWIAEIVACVGSARPCAAGSISVAHGATRCA